MAIEIRLPGLGESIAEGTVTAWLKQPGDFVARDEAFVTISTDKVETDLPSLEEGHLLVHAAAVGDVVQIGDVIAWFGAEGETVDPSLLVKKRAVDKARAPAAKPSKRAATPRRSQPSSSPRDPVARNRAFRAGGDAKLFVSPVVRRLARQHDVDLSALQGTGRGGRVSRRDIEAFIADGGAGSGFAEPPGGYQPGQRMPLGGFANRIVAPFEPATAARYAPQVHDGDEVVPLSGLGRAMAEHMAYTWWRSPHVSTIVEIDLARLAAWRSEHKASFLEAHGAKPSYTACIGWVVAQALTEHRDFNSSLTHDGQRIRHAAVNLGVAVAKGDGGLLVPVLADAGSSTLPAFAQSLTAMVDKTRSGAIKPADLQGGTFTITNVGSNGNLASMPLINQPQVAILATGAITKRVVVVTADDGSDEIAIRPRMFMTLTYDHRAVDGARSGRFLKAIRAGLEEWEPGDVSG
ncbi:MAG: 2-oxo acid dehydrogenase subunit E2 [Deltaproteobacteria bacterium]|nr:2-oxo acid dehydrogenase subunit E2 [Deltaproteobacteria bacterium]